MNLAYEKVGPGNWYKVTFYYYTRQPLPDAYAFDKALAKAISAVQGDGPYATVGQFIGGVCVLEQKEKSWK